MNKRRVRVTRLPTLFATLALALALAAACGKKATLPGAVDGSSKKNATLREQLEELQGAGGKVDVPVVKLKLGPISDERSITGELVPQRAVIVTPLMEGRITFIRKIKVGDHVKEGEVIAKIDDRDIEDNIERQEQQIKISDEKLTLDTEDAKQNKKNLEFDSQLVKEGYINQNEYEKSELQLKQAEVGLHQSKLSLEQERSKLKSLQRDREKVPIVSPIDGMVVMPSNLKSEQKTTDMLNEDILSLEDTLVSSGTPIFGVVSSQGYLAQCMVNGKDKSRLSVGQRARVIVIGDRPIEIGGEVAKIALLQEMDSHAYKVWIKLDKSDPSFNSGLFVRANIELERHASALSVDKEFVKERNNRSFVQTVADGVVKDVTVGTGIASADKIELTDGVKAGDIVIASKNAFLADQAVNPVLLKDNLASEVRLAPEGDPFPMFVYEKKSSKKNEKLELAFVLDNDTTATQATLELTFDRYAPVGGPGQAYVNGQGPIDIAGGAKAGEPAQADVPVKMLMHGMNTVAFAVADRGTYALRTATLVLSQNDAQ